MWENNVGVQVSMYSTVIPWFFFSFQCTHSCGKGVQHRRVTCHRVNAYGWIDPEPVSRGCNNTAKPPEVQTCVIADCRARFMWTLQPWEEVVPTQCFARK